MYFYYTTIRPSLRHGIFIQKSGSFYPKNPGRIGSCLKSHK
jgi:hypothetical protein